MQFTITFHPSGHKQPGVGNTLEEALNFAKHEAKTVRAGTVRFEIESNDGMVRKAWAWDHSEWTEVPNA